MAVQYIKLYMHTHNYTHTNTPKHARARFTAATVLYILMYACLFVSMYKLTK